MANIDDNILTHIRKDTIRHAWKFQLPYDEALSISFLALVEADLKFQHTKNVPFLPFARQCITYAHLDARRSRLKFRQGIKKFPRFREILETDLTCDGVKEAENRDFLRKIHKKIQKCNIKNKKVLELNAFHSLNFTEIGKKLKISKVAAHGNMRNFKLKHLTQLKEEFLV